MGAANRQTAATFWKEWQSRYGEVGPIAHQLRRAAAGHTWVRCYALPSGKRYAESAAEQREILRRAELLATALLGIGIACWLVQWQTLPLQASLRLQHNLRLPEPEDDFDWLGRVTQSNWQPGRFTRLMTDVANDRAGPLLWINRESGAIFAPYDGGFDLFPASLTERGRLQECYADWLSDHPDGL